MPEAERYPRNVIEALDGGKGLTERGYIFVAPDGTEVLFSWDRLRKEAIARAHHLKAMGLKKGDRMAMVVPDALDFVPTFLGALWAGVVPVPLYPPLSLGKLDAYVEALVATLGRARPARVCAAKKVMPVLWSAVGRVPDVQGMFAVEDLAAPAPGADETMPVFADSDLAFLQFTSGSTAFPRGVVVTHGNLGVNCKGIMVDGLRSQASVDVGVSWLPLYHDMGLIGFVLAPLFQKVHVVFLPTLSFIKNANLWLSTIHKHRGTITFAPNFAFSLAAKRARPELLAQWDLSCMRAFGCAAEPINPATLRAFLDTFAPCGLKPESLLPCYGMAEATLAISFIGMDETLKTEQISAPGYEEARRAEPATAAERERGLTRELVCCGRAFTGHELQVVDDQRRPLAERQVGEIALRGPSVAPGYFEDPESTAASFEDGWLYTGDMGYLANGEVYIGGRKKDLIIINGRNYDPQRIEWVVEEVPGMRKGNAVAFSRSGTDTEELIVAAESRASDPEALKDAVRRKVHAELQLAVSEVVLIAPGALPKTSSGKVQRHKVRAQYLAGALGAEGVRTTGARGRRFVVAKHLALSLVGRARHLLRRALARG